LTPPGGHLILLGRQEPKANERRVPEVKARWGNGGEATLLVSYKSNFRYATKPVKIKKGVGTLDQNDVPADLGLGLVNGKTVEFPDGGSKR